MSILRIVIQNGSSKYLNDRKSVPNEEVKQNRDDGNDGKKSDSNYLFLVCCVKFILCDSPKNVKRIMIQ